MYKLISLEKMILSLAMLLLTTSVNALEYRGELAVGWVRFNSTYAYVATNPQPSLTCNRDQKGQTRLKR